MSAANSSANIPVCLWSGPRNVSTALMYSFAQRPDTKVVDEPLYGHFLRVSGTVHPGRNEVMATLNCDGDQVMHKLLDEAQRIDKLLFLKQMAHHLVDLDEAFLRQTKNVFLVRDPQQMLPSLTIQLPEAQLADTGLQRQWQLYEELHATGQSPAIIDSRELLLNPAAILKLLCEHLDIPFDPTMLSWVAGPREEDGIWAKHWYEAVHKSTGFAAYNHKSEFPDRLRGLLEECQPWYDLLYQHAIHV